MESNFELRPHSCSASPRMSYLTFGASQPAFARVTGRRSRGRCVQALIIDQQTLRMFSPTVATVFVAHGCGLFAPDGGFPVWTWGRKGQPLCRAKGGQRTRETAVDGASMGHPGRGWRGLEVPGRRKSLARRHWCSYLTPRGDFLINFWLQSAQIIQRDEFPESLRVGTNLEKWDLGSRRHLV